MTRDAIDAFIEQHAQAAAPAASKAKAIDHERAALARFEALRNTTLDPAVEHAGSRLSAAGHEWALCDEPEVSCRCQGRGAAFMFFPKGTDRPADLVDHYPRLVFAPMTDRGLVTVRLETGIWSHEEFVHYDIVTPNYVSGRLAYLCLNAGEGVAVPKPKRDHTPAYADIFGKR